MAIIKFLLFVLTATLREMFLCGANDLITIFVSPECFNLCSYLLSGYTKEDVPSNEATMKYNYGWGKPFYSGSWFLLAIWFIRGRDQASKNSEWSCQYTNV